MHDELLKTIDILYDCAREGFDHQRAISQMSRALDDTGLCLVEIDLSGNFNLLAYENIPPQAMDVMVNGGWTPQDHGILRNFSIIPVGFPVLHRTVESDEEFYQSGLYKRAMEPWQLHSIGLCLLDKHPTGGVLNGFLRTPDKPEIGAEDLSRMSVLNKHLWRAMQLRDRIERIEEALIRTSNVLDLLEYGLVLLDDAAKPIYVNAAARHIFESRDGLTLERGRFSISDRQAQREFRSLTDTLSIAGIPISAKAGGVVRVPRSSLKRPYSLLAVPLGNSHFSGVEGAGAAVVIFDPAAQRTTVVDLFVASYDLTRAEARLAMALAEGASLDAYAEKQGISRNTAKSHLHSIFAKTHTSRQPELVSLLLRSIAGLNLTF